VLKKEQAPELFKLVSMFQGIPNKHLIGWNVPIGNSCIWRRS